MAASETEVQQAGACPVTGEGDLNRPNIARQMAFSSGTHRCLGLQITITRRQS